MAFIVLAATAIDKKSCISELLMAAIKTDLDYLKSCLTDGASSPQNLVSKSLTLSGNLIVNNSGLISGNANVLNLTSVPMFPISINSNQVLFLVGV